MNLRRSVSLHYSDHVVFCNLQVVYVGENWLDKTHAVEVSADHSSYNVDFEVGDLFRSEFAVQSHDELDVAFNAAERFGHNPHCSHRQYLDLHEFSESLRVEGIVGIDSYLVKAEFPKTITVKG